MPDVAVGQVWRHYLRGNRVEVVQVSAAKYGGSQGHAMVMRHIDKTGPDFILFQDRIGRRYRLEQREATNE